MIKQYNNPDTCEYKELIARTVTNSGQTKTSVEDVMERLDNAKSIFIAFDEKMEVLGFLVVKVPRDSYKEILAERYDNYDITTKEFEIGYFHVFPTYRGNTLGSDLLESCFESLKYNSENVFFTTCSENLVSLGKTFKMTDYRMEDSDIVLVM